MLLGGAISPDGKTLAIASCGFNENALHLISLEQEEEIAALSVKGGEHSQDAGSSAAGSDGPDTKGLGIRPVVTANRGAQEAVRIQRGRWIDDAEPGNLREERNAGLRVIDRAAFQVATYGNAHHHGRRKLVA